MKLKGILDEDFVNYKKPSMFIAFPHCSFKCEKESGVRCCQNSALANQQDIEVSVYDVVNRYMSNPITSAIVIGGLEPLDDLHDLEQLVTALRGRTSDDIVIYTGYTEEEAKLKLILVGLYRFENIIVKYGRYVPNSRPVKDNVLGVELASENQHAVQYTGTKPGQSRLQEVIP